MPEEHRSHEIVFSNAYSLGLYQADTKVKNQLVNCC